MIRKDYTAWSSPVSGQILKDFSPNTLDNRFYEYLFTGTTTATAYQSVSNVASTSFSPGKGYMIRVANDWSSSVPTIFNGQFEGVPNNGIITSSVGIGYNLLGNPYPSPIDANRILLTNPKIDALYYWTHNVPQDGAYVAQTNYASYTILGGTAAIAGGAVPNDYIQTGQGFFVEARESVDFVLSNEYRVEASNSTQFFRSDDSNRFANERHRIWIGLKGLNDVSYNQILVGYMSGASDGVDNNIDGKVFDLEKTILYSNINNEAFVIQGRSLPFNNQDKILVGFKALESGFYQIKIDNVDGLFVNQNIYLKDNFLNIYHNIKESEYVFMSEAGNFDNRFELIYKKPELTIDQELNNEIKIFNNNEALVINSSMSIIDFLLIFDVQGKKIFEQKVNDKECNIKGLLVKNQALIVQIKLDNGSIVNKKVIY
ncbi:MAG: hypothetical protein IE891_10465 [Flavobacteriaceae bacterium]|nr:hypothetical protein [Flavobacteriaceae bacterium]